MPLNVAGLPPIRPRGDYLSDATEHGVSVLTRCWFGLKPWIEAAKRRLHHNVLAIALANRLARIAWAVLNKERNFECVKTSEMACRSA